MAYLFSGLPQVPPGLDYFPAMWFMSEVTLPKENTENITKVVQLPEFVGTVAKYSLAPVILMIVAVLCILIKVNSCSRASAELEKVRDKCSETSHKEEFIDPNSSVIKNQSPDSPLLNKQLL